jgi:RNA polymerase sigma factor for flagellar operon FliA
MYSAQGTVSQDQMVERYAPLVKRIAYHLIGRLPPSVLVDDLIQAGMLGLLDAARQYDDTQGASFETYATIRIRGAMLDELRRNDWAPKSVHRKSRDVAAAIHKVEMRTGRDADDKAVAAELGISLDDYYRILNETASSRMLSFDEPGTDDRPMGEQLSDESGIPYNELEAEHFADSLATAIGELPEREQLVLSLYYDRELNLREIGEVLNVTESRISQILSKAHLRLRARLGEWRSEG